MEDAFLKSMTFGNGGCCCDECETIASLRVKKRVLLSDNSRDNCKTDWSVISPNQYIPPPGPPGVIRKLIYSSGNTKDGVFISRLTLLSGGRQIRESKSGGDRIVFIKDMKVSDTHQQTHKEPACVFVIDDDERRGLRQVKARKGEIIWIQGGESRGEIQFGFGLGKEKEKKIFITEKEEGEKERDRKRMKIEVEPTVSGWATAIVVKIFGNGVGEKNAFVSLVTKLRSESLEEKESRIRNVGGAQDSEAVRTVEEFVENFIK